MKLPTDVLYIVLDIASTSTVASKDFGAFLRFAMVCKAFKSIMYKKHIRRMFLSMHAIDSNRFRTWKEVGPQVTKLLSNPLFRFDDKVIINILSKIDTFNIPHKKEMLKFFGHRGQVKQHFPNAHPYEVITLPIDNYVVSFAVSAANSWSVGNKQFIIIYRPSLYVIINKKLIREKSVPFIIHPF